MTNEEAHEQLSHDEQYEMLGSIDSTIDILVVINDRIHEMRRKAAQERTPAVYTEHYRVVLGTLVSGARLIEKYATQLGNQLPKEEYQPRDDHKRDYLHAEGLNVEWSWPQLTEAGWRYKSGCVCDVCMMWREDAATKGDMV